MREIEPRDNLCSMDIGSSTLLHHGVTYSAPVKAHNVPYWTQVCLLTQGQGYNFPVYQERQKRSPVEIEEENLYEVDEQALDDLRKQHRVKASHQHVGKDGLQFSDFPLNPKLIARLNDLGYKEPFEIQVKTLLQTLEGRDVIGKAVTGSGKTLAFSIPIVHKVAERKRIGRSRNPVAIVIAPTRELCLQIHRSVQELDSSVRCVAVYGGDSYTRQEREIRRGVDVICATPGRLRDHIDRGNIGLDELEFLCLDEADELLTPNFKEQIRDVLDNSPDETQMMLFSATMAPEIRDIANRYMDRPVFVDITANQKYKAPESVKHLCMKVPPRAYISVTRSLIQQYNPERCIIFTDTKVRTLEVTNELRRGGIPAEAINSDLSQQRRENVMRAFRKGMVKVLVGTDVAARGLDIPEVDLVLQMGPPRNGTEYYIHRAGRTGRAGREGVAIMLHSGDRQDQDLIYQIQRLCPMQHISPPDQTEVLREEAERVLAQLQKMPLTKSQDMLPVVQKLDIGGEQTTQLLAAALNYIVKGPDRERKSHGIPSPTRGSYSKSRSHQYQDFNKFSSNKYNRYSKPQFNRQGHRSGLRDEEW